MTQRGEKCPVTREYSEFLGGSGGDGALVTKRSMVGKM